VVNVVRRGDAAVRVVAQRDQNQQLGFHVSKCPQAGMRSSVTTARGACR
jgi:hypothetical protein